MNENEKTLREIIKNLEQEVLEIKDMLKFVMTNLFNEEKPQKNVNPPQKKESMEDFYFFISDRLPEVVQIFQGKKFDEVRIMLNEITGLNVSDKENLQNSFSMYIQKIDELIESGWTIQDWMNKRKNAP